MMWLWFDDEIEWYTTKVDELPAYYLLWFDDEIEWYTTDCLFYFYNASCGLMMKWDDKQRSNVKTSGTAVVIYDEVDLCDGCYI